METIKQILVVSRLIPYSRKTLEFGIYLAREHHAKLHVLHLVSNTVDMMATNAPGPFPEEQYEQYNTSLEEAKKLLNAVIEQEKQNAYPIHELVSDRDPVEEIERVVSEEKIDLLLMSAHEEGRIEHALFGGENDTIVRKMPCSILLVKNEPGPVAW